MKRSTTEERWCAVLGPAEKSESVHENDEAVVLVLQAVLGRLLISDVLAASQGIKAGTKLSYLFASPDARSSCTSSKVPIVPVGVVAKRVVSFPPAFP